MQIDLNYTYSKFKTLYAEANKNRLFRAIGIGAFAGGSAVFLASPGYDLTIFKRIWAASVTSGIVAGINFVRQPQSIN